jgi:hypothetical protein
MTILNIFVSSPDTHSERRLESTSTIAQLKVSIGTHSLSTRLILRLSGQVDSYNRYTTSISGNEALRLLGVQ